MDFDSSAGFAEGETGGRSGDRQGGFPFGRVSVETTQHTTDCDAKRGPTGRSDSVAWVIHSALFGLILAPCAASANEPAEGPLPGALLPSDAAGSSACGPTAGLGAAALHRPCLLGLSCAPGAQIFCRPRPVCLPAGEGAQLFHRPCRLDMPCAAGAQFFCRPCPVCLPAGEGAQLFRRPCPCCLPDGTGAQLYRRPCGLHLPEGLGAQLFPRHCTDGPRPADACPPP